MIDKDQHEQIEYAQQRIRQKKRLYNHFVLFLIGSVFLVLINKVFKYGVEYDWFEWAILLWAFLFAIHVFNVFVTQRFMGRDWERNQREKLVHKQQKRIAEMEQEMNAALTPEVSAKKKSRMSQLVMIAAAGKNNELGKDNALPWHLPNDFKRFKRLTTGHTMIMGRKTFESFPKPLINRKHIIISRNKTYSVDHPDCIVVHSLEEAIGSLPKNQVSFVIGGGEIYRQAMPYCDVIELTRVDGTFAADAYFPDIDPHTWELKASEFHPSDAKHPFAFTYETYRRIGS